MRGSLVDYQIIYQTLCFMAVFKRIAFVLIILSVCCVGRARCQVINYGLKAGVNASNFSIRTNAFGPGLKNMWKPILVSQAGVFIEAPLGKRTGIQAELLYNINGSNIQTSQTSKSYAHFLSVPLVLNVHLGKRVTFEVGPQASIVLKPRKSLLLIDTHMDLALVGGLKMKMFPSWSTGLRFVQGIAPLGTLVTADEKGQPKNIRDFYSRNLQFSVAYQFSKKQKRQ